MNVGKLKLWFVPVWLETALAHAAKGLVTATDLADLARILSTRDLELYHYANGNLDKLLPAPVLQSFVIQTSKAYDWSVHEGHGSSEPDLKRVLLYGRGPDACNQPLTPGYRIHQVGMDDVVLTVDMNHSFNSNHLMEALLAVYNARLPLADMAQLVMFERWAASCIRPSA